jgi:aminoglycoside 6'-N-acetyltransferase
MGSISFRRVIRADFPLLSGFAERIWSVNPGASCFIVPVNSANEASWKALLKAGFRVVVRGDLEPDKPIDDPSHEILRLDRPTRGDAESRRGNNDAD